MAITKLEENLNVIENLPDSPTLEPVELKRKFDEGAIKIKEYINDVLTKEIDALASQIKKDASAKILADNKKKYYVGRLVLDTRNVNPATYLGFGTWKLWGAGRVPVGVNTDDSAFNTVEKIGGAKTHTLTVAQLPKTNFKIPHVQFYDSCNGTGYTETRLKNGNHEGASSDTSSNYGWHIMSSGGGQAHNNLQPYITCYIWKRTA